MTDQVPVPDRLKNRPFFRGMPVPYSVKWDGDIPDFKSVSPKKLRRCVENVLCGLCGQSMKHEQHMAFIGGPVSLENRTYVDPPMHEECAVYAVQICPHLAKGKDFSPTSKKQAAEQGIVPIMGGDTFVLLTQGAGFNGTFFAVPAELVTGIRTFDHGVEKIDDKRGEGSGTATG